MGTGCWISVFFNGEQWRFSSSVFVEAVVVRHSEEELKKGWACRRKGLSLVLGFHGRLASSFSFE